MKKEPKVVGAVLVVLMFVLIVGCGGNPRWYKPGHGQVDFNIDNLECRRTAEEIARQSTLTRNKVDPEIYATAYENCIFSKGWTHTPLNAGQAKVQPVALAEVSGNVITVFDQQIQLPQDFMLKTNKVAGHQDLRIQTLSFQGNGPVFLTMVVQQTLSRKFTPVDYPVNDPFFVFEQGEEKIEAGQLRWTLFAGAFRGEWVTGMGAYLLVGKTQRITFVMTQNMSPPEKTPPEGLRLTQRQKNEIIAIKPGLLSFLRSKP